MKSNTTPVPMIPPSAEAERIRLARAAAADAYMATFDLDELNRRRATALVRQAFLDGFDAGNQEVLALIQGEETDGVSPNSPT
jgi:hypothetical protein